MVVDWEHHYLPEELILKKGGTKGKKTIVYEQGKPRGDLNPELADIEGHLKVMDAAGIDLAVLSMAVTSDDTEVALEECRIWDDKAAELIKKYPQRFTALAPIPALAGERAFAELKRAIEELGLKGAVIRSQVQGLSMDAQELYPFYEQAAALKIPILIHPSGVQQGFEILNAPYDLNRSIGREMDLVVATTRLILSGVVDDFSDLKFVISHKGGGIAALKHRLECHFGATRSPSKKQTFTRNRLSFEECFDKLYFNLAGDQGWMGSVQCALTGISPQRLVFGTDYPQHFRDEPLKIGTFIQNIRNLNLSEKDKEAILGGNSRQLLNV